LREQQFLQPLGFFEKAQQFAVQTQSKALLLSQ
jgi:hypothetical protein